MVNSRSENGYVKALDGIKIKTLVYGEKTLMSEFRMEAGSTLPAHSHAVLEAWPQPGGGPALAWRWAALPAAAVAPLDWRQTVAAPARDLGQAGLVLLDAAGRLAKGLLGLAVWALARPWVASPLARGAVRRIPWGLHSG